MNVEKRVIEVQTEPREGVYSRVTEVPVGGTIRLVRIPDVGVAVARVFG